MPGPHHRRGGLRAGATAMRVALVAGLAADAAVHFRLAARYQEAAPGGVGEGTLFRLQAAAAAVCAVAVVLRASRSVLAVSAAVAAAALGAVLLYTYVDVPAFGPVPSMYEPVWFPQKSLSALAEAVAVLAALALLARRQGGRPGQRRGRGVAQHSPR